MEILLGIAWSMMFVVLLTWRFLSAFVERKHGMMVLDGLLMDGLFCCDERDVLAWSARTF